MSYWWRAGTWARQHTKTFTVIKAIPSVLAAIGQYRFFGMRPMKETGFVILTLFGSYVLLYAIDFIGKILFMAPPALDKQALENTARRQSEMARSHAEEVGRWYRGRIEIDSALADCKDRLAKKHPADEYKESEVRKWIDGLDDSERFVFRWIFSRGPATAHEIRDGVGLQRQDSIIALVTKGKENGFIQTNNTSPYPNHRIHDNYHDAVKNVLYPPNSVT
jgi:hypothetical protein